MKIKVSKKKDYRELLARNLVTSLILHESIITTPTRAKLTTSLFNDLIANTKSKDLNAKKYAKKILLDNKAVLKVFEDVLPRLENTSGLVTIVKLNNRLGDNAGQVKLSIILKPIILKETKKDKIKDSETNQNENKVTDKEDETTK